MPPRTHIDRTLNVQVTEFLPTDPRDLYRQKIARITLDSMVQFVGLLDAAGTVLEINQVALDAVGITLADVEGKPFWTTFWWQVSDEIRETLKALVLRASQGEFVRWDAEIYGRAGGRETIIIDASLAPVKDDHGNVVFITAEGRDITEKKAHEREIARQREELAKLDVAKTQFFANVSHEFRTPLTLMLGPIEDALGDPAASLPAQQIERLMMARRNGLRLEKLVNALLDFSRVEAGRVQADYQPTDLASLTRDLASSFQAACDKAGLALIIDAPPLPEAVFVDRDMWEKIVFNLVSNAFKFTMAGEIRVEVRASADHARLRVIDTGVGIPDAELPRIFERFHRVENVRGRTHEGTGIGLALVRELVKLHGGSVSAESTEGVGTTFTVEIPFGSAHIPQDRIGATTTLASTATRADAFVSEALRWLPGPADEIIATESGLTSTMTNGERPRILLADDNADMRDYLSRLLLPAYEVTAVTNGEEALAAARQARPDLVLSDVMMPRLDGFELLRELRSDAALREVPVLLLSARAGEEAKLEGLRIGADDYLLKPFSARELLARIAANVELARARSERAHLLSEQTEALERRVAVEIAERMKAQETVRQAQRMETIGQLTGGVAHDFNNLLQVISGNLYVLQQHVVKGTSTSDDLRLIEGAIRGTRRAATLTQRLLAFARRQPLDPKPLDVNRLVSGMSELLRRTLGESIGIETVLVSGLWRISADAGELENALLNLAVNARDAMASGGRLTIETANSYIDEAYAADYDELAPGQYVMIAVSDTGTGMSKEVSAKAFEPFFTTKDSGHGTGLGLSQVYGFVKQSGGHVKIYSEPGDGTTVKIYMPRLRDAHQEPVPEPSRPPLMLAGDGDVILVVEDDEDVRANTITMLHELGYGVLEAADGVAALRMLQSEPRIDLLFTDVGLPGGINGRQLSERAREVRPGLRVLFTSGYARNAITHQGRLDVGVELISKPFTFDQLANKIRQMLNA